MCGVSGFFFRAAWRNAVPWCTPKTSTDWGLLRICWAGLRQQSPSNTYFAPFQALYMSAGLSFQHRVIGFGLLMPFGQYGAMEVWGACCLLLAGTSKQEEWRVVYLQLYIAERHRQHLHCSICWQHWQLGRSPCVIDYVCQIVGVWELLGWMQAELLTVSRVCTTPKTRKDV